MAEIERRALNPQLVATNPLAHYVATRLKELHEAVAHSFRLSVVGGSRSDLERRSYHRAQCEGAILELHALARTYGWLPPEPGETLAWLTAERPSKEAVFASLGLTPPQRRQDQRSGAQATDVVQPDLDERAADPGAAPHG